MSIKLTDFNHHSKSEAAEALLTCCGSRVWAARMADSRPFSTCQQMGEKAGRIWLSLAAEDWREAFAHHPRIGETNLRAKWAADEQKGTRTATEEVLRALADGNRDYEARFGHVFLICATGKSAPEMLAALQSRMSNSAEKELQVAAGEQLKITHLRLEKLFYD